MINNILIGKISSDPNTDMAGFGQHVSYPWSAMYFAEFKTPSHQVKSMSLPVQDFCFSFLIFPCLVS